MVNFGFLLFSMVNIFKITGRPCIWFVIVDTIICYTYTYNFQTFVLGNIETGIVFDFILITIFWPKLAAIMHFEVLFDM